MISAIFKIWPTCLRAHEHACSMIEVDCDENRLMHQTLSKWRRLQFECSNYYAMNAMIMRFKIQFAFDQQIHISMRSLNLSLSRLKCLQAFGRPQFNAFALKFEFIMCKYRMFYIVAEWIDDNAKTTHFNTWCIHYTHTCFPFSPTVSVSCCFHLPFIWRFYRQKLYNHLCVQTRLYLERMAKKYMKKEPNKMKQQQNHRKQRKAF